MASRRSPPKSTPASVRRRWKETYESTPFAHLPWFQPGPSPHVERAVREGLVPPGSETLDIGCGAGSNVLFLARSGCNSHGIDLAPGAVAAARQRAREEGLKVDVREGDALDLPFEASSLDVVVDNGCFHTLDFAHREAYANELARVLRPQGLLLLGWIGRETVTEEGPPHRPSLHEATETFEPKFLFLRVWVSQTPLERGESEYGWTTYYSWLRRRPGPPPPLR